MSTLFTMGYQGLDTERFIQALQAHGIQVVVDVRANAWSRKPGFAKRALAAALAEAGIDYQPWPELGNPRELRNLARQTGDVEAMWEGYRAHLDAQADALRELLALAARERCCLLCLEADPAECHRSLIAQRLIEMAGGELEVVHLRAGPPPGRQMSLLEGS